MLENTERLNRAEALVIAGQIAPVLRRRAHAGHVRKITVVGPNGTPLYQITDIELAKRLHARAGVEFDVEDGERPDRIVCACGAVQRTPPRGPIPKYCKRCAPERKREADREWRAANLEKAREAQRKYRAKKKAEL